MDARTMPTIFGTQTELTQGSRVHLICRPTPFKTSGHTITPPFTYRMLLWSESVSIDASNAAPIPPRKQLKLIGPNTGGGEDVIHKDKWTSGAVGHGE